MMYDGTLKLKWNDGLQFNNIYGEEIEDATLLLSKSDAVDLLGILVEMLRTAPQQQIVNYHDYELWISAYDESDLSILIMDTSVFPKSKLCTIGYNKYAGNETMISGIMSMCSELAGDNAGSMMLLEFNRGLKFKHWDSERKQSFCDIELSVTAEQAVPFLCDIVDLLDSTSDFAILRVAQYSVSVRKAGAMTMFRFSTTGEISGDTLDFMYSKYYDGRTLQRGITDVKIKAASYVR